MQMLRITKRVIFFLHTLPHTDVVNGFFSEIALTALKYETPMFQKFITCFSDMSYIAYGFMYMLFLD